MDNGWFNTVESMGLFEVPFFSDKLIQAGDLFKIIQVQDDASTVELAHLSEFRYGCGQLYFNHQASYIYSWFMLVLYTHHLYCWLHIDPHISIIHGLNPLKTDWFDPYHGGSSGHLLQII